MTRSSEVARGSRAQGKHDYLNGCSKVARGQLSLEQMGVVRFGHWLEIFFGEVFSAGHREC